MSKKTKIWLITASLMVLVGCMIFTGVMTMIKWDFKKLSTVKYETNSYEITEEYTNISLTTDTADILFAASKDDKTSVVCYEEKKFKHSVEVQEGTLVIKKDNGQKWYDYIGINIGIPKITVYIPEGEHGNLSIKSSTGDVKIPKEFKFQSIDISESTGDIKNYASASEGIKLKTSTGNIITDNISADMFDASVTTGKIFLTKASIKGDIKIKVSTGDAKLTDVSCTDFSSNGSTGDITLKNTVATGKVYIKRSTGDVKFDGCDGGELFIETDTGNVIGSLFSEKIFIINTDTGNVNVPKTLNGGKCEISTDTGDIEICID